MLFSSLIVTKNNSFASTGFDSKYISFSLRGETIISLKDSLNFVCGEIVAFPLNSDGQLFFIIALKIIPPEDDLMKK